MSNNILAPEYITQQLARRAVEIATIIGPRKSGRGLSGLTPIWQEGVVGIQVPDQNQYMLDLDQGIEEHPMEDLAGRVIPIRDPSGSIVFRRASANKIGQVPVITRLADDGRLSDGKAAWVYPRKDGLNFLHQAIQNSIDEWCKTATTQNIIDMLLKTSVRDDISMIVYGRESA